MKKLFSLILMFLFVPTAVFAAGNVGLNQATEDLNVRYQPKFASNNRIDHLKKGQTIKVKKVVGRWCQVEYKKYRSAYVACAYLKPVEMISSVETDIPTPVQVPVQDLDCSKLLGEDKKVERSICEGMNKLAQVDSASFDLSINTDLKDDFSDFASNIDLSFLGEADFSTTTDPKLNLTVEGKVLSSLDELAGKVEMKMNKENFFFFVKELSGKGGMEITDEIKASVVGKWWRLPIPAEVLKDFAAQENTLIEEQIKLRNLFGNTIFWKDLKYVKSEKIMGEESDTYSFRVNGDGLINFMAEAHKISGLSFSANDKSELKDDFERFNLLGKISITKGSGIVNRLNLVMQVREKEDFSGEIVIDLSFGNFNKAVKVQAPTTSTEIPLESLFSF